MLFVRKLPLQECRNGKEILAAVYFMCTSEDDIYVQAATGLILDMLDRYFFFNFERNNCTLYFIFY